MAIDQEERTEIKRQVYSPSLWEILFIFVFYGEILGHPWLSTRSILTRSLIIISLRLEAALSGPQRAKRWIWIWI